MIRLCEQRLKIRVESIIRDIQERETTCEHSKKWNVKQERYFKNILIDIIFAIRNDMPMSDHVEDMLFSWKEADNSHVKFVYGIVS